MNDNKGQTIFLSVIGIATLLVAIIGATFAYFTTTMTGIDKDVSATTATVPTLRFNADAMTVNDKIFPGWTQSGNIQIIATTNAATAKDVKFVCELTMTGDNKGNSIDDMYIKAERDNTKDGQTVDDTDYSGYGHTITVANEMPETKINSISGLTNTDGTYTGTIKLFEGTLPAGTASNQEINVKYTLEFKDTLGGEDGETDQNSQMNKTIAGVVSCKLKDDNGSGSAIYYNQTNQGGTTTKPTAPSGN